MDRDRLILMTSDLSHRKFLEAYRRDDNGTRVKTTTDAAWIREHGTDQTDLAKLPYAELPDDWKRERRAGAEIAVDIVLEALRLQTPIDEAFIENASAIVHDEWLSRNSGRASAEHKVSYGQLSDEAKEKDRFFVRSAIEAYHRSASGTDMK